MITHNIEQWRFKRKMPGEKKKGITKAHLARKINVNRSYITKLEQGAIQPSSEIMFKIADYFECKVEEIFQYQPDNKK